MVVALTVVTATGASVVEAVDALHAFGIAGAVATSALAIAGLLVLGFRASRWVYRALDFLMDQLTENGGESTKDKLVSLTGDVGAMRVELRANQDALQARYESVDVVRDHYVLLSETMTEVRDDVADMKGQIATAVGELEAYRTRLETLERECPLLKAAS